MWVRSGRFLALLLALLLCSSLVFSAGEEPMYLLTETEFLQLQAIFGMLKTENNELKGHLATSMQEVSGLKANSEKLRTELQEVKDSLTKASESLRIYAADMNQALLTARTKTVIYAVIGVAAGGLAGYLIGAF